MANSKAAKQYNFKTSQLFQVVSADAVKGLQKFLYEITSEHAIGPDGYLADKGFIPLDDRGRKSTRDAALSLTPIAW